MNPRGSSNGAGGKSSADCFRVQRQIRENAQEMQDYLSELRQWEKAIERKDEEVRSKRAQHKAVPVRASCGSVGVRSSGVGVASPAAGPQSLTTTSSCRCGGMGAWSG